MKKILLFIQIIIAFLPLATYAQQGTVSGIVKDADGALPGVTVYEKGLPTNGISTDAQGRFRLRLKGASNTIVVKNLGYVTREIKVNDQKPVEIILQANNQGLEEVLVVGYGTKTRITNTGAVSSISADKIKNIPTSSVQNTLAGRLPGFFSQQRSGQPGKDASDFFIRGVSSLNGDGNRPLIVVDDIEYTYEQLSQINVNEIETISILKDASTTAIYGIKGANGVLVVKTRRGTLGTPKVTVRVETGMQSAVKTPQFLDSYHTAVLRNEALSSDGLPAQFSQNDLALFKNGQDPYGHPNVNWYDEIFKPYSLQSNGNIDISGGTEKVKYFLSGGAFTQNGAVRDFSTDRSEVNSNYYYNRYTFRTNLDVEATKTLNIRLDLTGRFGEINTPAVNDNLLTEIYNYERTTPYGAPVLNPNLSYAYNKYSSNYLATINSRIATKGYNLTRRSDFNILLEGNQKLDAITQGLSFKGRVSYASTSDIYRGLFRFDDPPTYLYDPATGSYTRPPGGKFVLSQFVLRAGNNYAYKSVNLQGLLNYDRNFGLNHVYSLLLFNQDSNNNLSDLPTNYRGYSLRLGYEYNQKYLFDFNMAYNGTDRFAKHYGYFPAASAGWNISKENFFKDNISFINLLKLRGSYGLVGSDVVTANKYLYQQNYARGGVIKLGETSADYTGIYEGALGNDLVTWEKQREVDIGLDLNAFNDKFSLTFDYFRNIRYDQLISRNSISQVLGVDLPKVNLGRVINSGFDGQFTYRPNIGKVQFDLGLVFSYAKNKILYFDEALPNFPYLQRTGQPLGQPFGYTWIGFYKDETDIANSPKPVTSQPIKPGDLKYKDLNSDGVIDQNDMGAIGKPNLPNLTIGIPFGVHYKGLDVNILFQGSYNYSLILTNSAIEPFQSQLQPVHELRWTPETANTAQFPRLTTIRNSVNSPAAYPSDFWLINAQFLRLKTVELGYQLPAKALPFKISNARIYLSAYNLITWTNYSLYQQDPEVASNTVGDSYLNQRVINLGVQIGL